MERDRYFDKLRSIEVGFVPVHVFDFSFSFYKEPKIAFLRMHGKGRNFCLHLQWGCCVMELVKKGRLTERLLPLLLTPVCTKRLCEVMPEDHYTHGSNAAMRWWSSDIFWCYEINR